MTTPLRLHSAGPTAAVPEPTDRGVTLRPELLEAFRAGRGTERLRLPGALAVTTGQQPGLFGGPLYTVHKAIAALAVARELERRWKRPVVPIFWVAGDDHDWMEASSAAWWGPDDAVRRWQLEAQAPESPQLAMSRIPVPRAGLQSARDAFAGDLSYGPFRDLALDWVDRHWGGGQTMATAFATAMHELLDPLGVAILDPTHTAFKAAQRPVLRAALAQNPTLDAALAALPDAGTGIAAGDGATLVFLEATDGRDRLIQTGDGQFVTRRSGEAFTSADLEDLLERAPERFSANVLLRPVVEAALLPTVGYVAGPGEARYLTHQASVLYPILDVEPQAVIPRWSGAILDATSDRLLGRLGLSADDVIHGGAELERSIVMRDMPPQATAALARLEQSIAETAATLTTTGLGIDAVLGRAVTSRTGKMLGVARDLEDLLRRHLKRRDDIAWAQYGRLRGRLVPGGTPQERTISVAAALGLYGPQWIEAVVEATTEWAARILEASPDGA